MSIYAISDLHLSFGEKVEKPMDIYGSKWVNHAERLYENWQQTITSTDTVLIAGDVSWGLRMNEALPDLQWIDELPGKKIIVKGNHDLWWASTNKLNKMFDSITFLQNQYCKVENFALCGSRGWSCPGSDEFNVQDEKIYNRELLRMSFSLEAAKYGKEKNIIVVMHYPPTNDKLQPSGFTKLFEKYGVKTVVYGHLHGKDGFGKGLKGNLNGVEYKLSSLDYLDSCLMKLY